MEKEEEGRNYKTADKLKKRMKWNEDRGRGRGKKEKKEKGDNEWRKKNEERWK